MNNNVIKKIAIVGPESTGKSTIAVQLAKHYQTVWVPEYARYYCQNLQNPCTLQDEENMFIGQVALEEAMLAICTQNIIFCDTTFITVKIWSDEMLGETPQSVLDALPKHPYDFYLLMDIDLPWEDDPLRDFPNQREYFMSIWHKELQSLHADYAIVSGDADARLGCAIGLVDKFLTANP